MIQDFQIIEILITEIQQMTFSEMIETTILNLDRIQEINPLFSIIIPIETLDFSIIISNNKDKNLDGEIQIRVIGDQIIKEIKVVGVIKEIKVILDFGIIEITETIKVVGEIIKVIKEIGEIKEINEIHFFQTIIEIIGDKITKEIHSFSKIKIRVKIRIHFLAKVTTTIIILDNKMLIHFLIINRIHEIHLFSEIIKIIINNNKDFFLKTMEDFSLNKITIVVSLEINKIKIIKEIFLIRDPINQVFSLNKIINKINTNPNQINTNINNNIFKILNYFNHTIHNKIQFQLLISPFNQFN